MNFDAKQQGKSMKYMNPIIRRIPEPLWKEFKIVCVREGVSMTEKIRQMVRDVVKGQKGE